MKFLLASIGILGSGILGYVLEPALRYGITGMEPRIPSTSEIVDQPAADGTPAPALAYDLSNLQPNQLPEKIVLKTQAIATAPGETDAVPLPAGTKVKPLRIEGSYVHFSVLGTAQGKIAVAQTNLVEQLLASPPPAPVVPIAPPVAPAPVEVAKVEPPPAPVVVPMPEPAPAPVIAPEPTPEPAPTPTASASTLSADEIVKVMQESIRSGQIKEFTFDQVIGWKAAEVEAVNGENFQTGLAAYKAETIFGVKNIQAKALIKGGKVIRWIWPTSGLEIE